MRPDKTKNGSNNGTEQSNYEFAQAEKLPGMQSRSGVRVP